MRTKVEFREARIEDVRFLAPRLREADKNEVSALGFRTPLAALEASFFSSDAAFTGLIDGVPAMMFGVGAPLFAEFGTVWALGTDTLTAHPREMLVYGRRKIRELLEEFPDRKIYVTDSLTASSGFGMLVDLCCDRRDEGMSIEELDSYVRSVRGQQNAWFFTNDILRQTPFY